MPSPAPNVLASAEMGLGAKGAEGDPKPQMSSLDSCSRASFMTDHAALTTLGLRIAFAPNPVHAPAMTSSPPNIHLSFHGGTVRVTGLAESDATTLPPACSWDARENCFRLPASAYAESVLWLRARKLPFTDEAPG